MSEPVTITLNLDGARILEHVRRWMTVRPPGQPPELGPDGAQPCRYCGHDVILGKRGWRRPDVLNSTSYDCPDAPRRYHGTGKP